VSEPVLKYEKRDGVAVITFNRPAVLNAITPEGFCRLADAWRDYAADDSLRVAIITGAGDRAFTAGADLGTFVPLITGARPPADEWDRRIVEDGVGDDAMLRRFTLYKPIVAAINGLAFGAGSEMIQAFDIRIAAENAMFGVTEVALGIMPGGGSTVRLPRQIPYCKAMEIILTGGRMGAAEAHRIGFVNEVVPQAEVFRRAMELARMIAANGPVAVRKAKETVLEALGLPLAAGFRLEQENAAVALATEDAKEGPRAFLEKRPPRYVGR